MTEFERINRQKFGESLKRLPDLIVNGASFDQCVAMVLNDNGWNYITSDEWGLIKTIHRYLTQK